VKSPVKALFARLGFEIRRIPTRSTPRIGVDADLYRPLFSPWHCRTGEFWECYQPARERSVVSVERCFVLYALLRQALCIEGDVFECGVYKGGTAAMMAEVLRRRDSGKQLFLFDSFRGLPEVDPDKDVHRPGEFADTSTEGVKSYLADRGLLRSCVLREGVIPEVFRGLESRTIALAHVDVDLYRSVSDSLEFVWPRIAIGGVLIVDDYGFPSCPGARAAVDEFFVDQACVPLCLPTGQAIVFKSTDA